MAETYALIYLVTVLALGLAAAARTSRRHRRPAQRQRVTPNVVRLEQLSRRAHRKVAS